MGRHLSMRVEGCWSVPFFEFGRLVGLENLSKLNPFRGIRLGQGGPDGAPFNLPTAPSAYHGGVESYADSSVEAARRIALLPECIYITCFGVGDGVLIRQLLETGNKGESCPFGPASRSYFSRI